MPPTNTTPGTAIDITTLPYQFVGDVTGLSVPYTLWWKRTAISDDIMLGLSAYSQVGTDYVPQITFWMFDSGAVFTQIDPTNYTIATDTACQFPVNVGTVYYIKVEDDGTGIAPGILVFDVKASPSSAIPIGSLFVNDDTESLDANSAFAGIYASILNQNTGAVIAQARTTVGEEGAILTDGTMMLQNDDAISESPLLYLYDSAFTQITTIALTGSEVCLNANGLLFYRTERISPSANSTLKTYNNAGVLQNTYAITAYRPQSIAVKKDNTIVYMSASALASPIKTFTLGTLALANLVNPGVANYSIPKGGLQVLADGNIVAGWARPALSLISVIIYDAAGVVQHTYPFTVPGAYSDGPRIAVSDTDASFYWIWGSGTVSGTRQSKFSKIRVSDGAELITFTVNVFESGSGPLGGGNDVPSQYFGNSKSCPLLILPIATTPPTDNASGLYVLTPGLTHDILFTNDSTTINTKIPDPFAIIYPIGD